ncbi:MAG: S8 family serine peptidase [Caldilinea sp.]|nr:S8 family serine peptidase [Caldilinea sp.]
MNRIRIAVAAAVLALTSFGSLFFWASTEAASELPTPTGLAASGQLHAPSYAAGVVLVGFREVVTIEDGVSGAATNEPALNEMLAGFGLMSMEPLFAGDYRRAEPFRHAGAVDLTDVYRLYFPAESDVTAIAEALSSHPAVVYAEPDYLAHLIVVPIDPEVSAQWALDKISLPAAWDVHTGTPEVAIAIIDAGIDATHPDLLGKLWTNPGEIAGNGIDDDNNGRVDDLNGWNLVDNNADLSDSTGHGTEIAGITGALTNNPVGIAGVCWQCRLMVVKVAQAGGVANYSDIAEGVLYALQKGAKVINISLGGYSDSITLKNAVMAAVEHAVVVAGAGNDNSTTPFYPAAYAPYVLAVAGTTQGDQKVATSNYGPWVSVAAPGEVIRTTFAGGGYGDISGTSAAAPFVAGLAGLLRSQYPDWPASLARAQVAMTANSLTGADPTYGWGMGSGRIDAHGALTEQPRPQLVLRNHAIDGEVNGVLEPGQSAAVDVGLLNEWGAAVDVQASLSEADPYVTVDVPSASFGVLDTYQEKIGQLPFQVTLSPAAPHGRAIPFTLNLTADGGYVHTVVFTMTTSSGIQEVSGVIPANTTWTAANVYLVTGNLLVPSGVTLTIEAGTVVKVQAQRYIRVDGALLAEGNDDDLVHFTSAVDAPSSTNDYWSGIRVMSGGYGAFRHCWFEYAYSGALKAEAGPILVEDSFFTRNADYLLDVRAGPSIIRRNRIWENGTGGAMYPVILGGEVSFVQNLVYGNYAWNPFPSPAVLQLSSGAVVSNTIIDNSLNGIEGTSSAGVHHNNLLRNLPYDVRTASAAITMTAFYWGIPTTAEMVAEGANSNIAAIYDYYDDFNLGRVAYAGWLTAPEPTAPAFVQTIGIDPSGVIGIEQAVFELRFSAPMDQGVTPAVVLSNTQESVSFAIGTDTEWLSANVWRGAFDVTSLVPRGTYTISVREARGSDAMEIPPFSHASVVVDYASEITDQTPPIVPTVFASGKQGDPATVEIAWSGSDPDSPITSYQYAIGSSPGSVDIVNWTPTTQTGVARTGLGLFDGMQYWVSVRARNAGGLWSTSGYASFVAGRSGQKLFLPVMLR